MFLRGRMARILGTVMAALSCVSWVRHAVAGSYVLAENSCVRYTDDWNTGDCTYYNFESCAEGCIEVPFIYDSPYYMTGSTDPRDFQTMCIGVKDNGTGWYSSDEWVRFDTGLSFYGSDDYGSYELDVSGCLLYTPITTGRYGAEECEAPMDSCNLDNWTEFMLCVNNLGCILPDMYTGIECAQNKDTCEWTTGRVICSQYHDDSCTLFNQATGSCTVTNPEYRTKADWFNSINRACGDIKTPFGTFREARSIDDASECGTGYML